MIIIPKMYLDNVFRFEKEIKEIAKECIKAREKAILIPSSSTRVGAVLFDSDGNKYLGYNIQNRVHKSYHAEEIAVLNALLQGADMKKMVGMAVSFSKTIKDLTFCCGCCRQVMWEYIQNPDLIIYEISIEDGSIVDSKMLSELYPFPYPR